MGYRRPDGSFGARNEVMVILGGYVATTICQTVRGTVTIQTPEVGYARTSRDRETGGRFLVNLDKNPNVAAVIVHGDAGASSYTSSGAYDETMYHTDPFAIYFQDPIF
jgi:altronate dehydratase